MATIVMVCTKNKEQILDGIGDMLLAEANTPEVRAEILARAESKVTELQVTCETQVGKMVELKAARKAAILEDDDSAEDSISAQIQEMKNWLAEHPVPTVEEMVQYETKKLVSEQKKLAEYEKWAGIFGLEGKKSLGRPAGGDKEHKAESKFEGQWSRELTNGTQCVNFRLLTDEQKTRNNLTNAAQWIVKVGDKVQVAEATAPNNLIMVAKLLLGQSVASGVNNSTWNEGRELTAAQIANF